MADPSSNREAVLNRLADEFAARYRRGERPALREYVDKYPELAEDIRDLFPALAEIEQIKEDAGGIETYSIVPPFKEFGDYRILREIGRGGMGVVYEAEQVSLGRHVALKVLPQKRLLDVKTRRRFEREAKAAAKLHHTNIVPVFGVGEQDGLPYFVMQYIQGLGLDEVIEELKRLAEHKPDRTLRSDEASRTQADTGSLPQPKPATMARHKDISAADVARSLMSGVFQSLSDTVIQSVPSPANDSAVTVAGSRPTPLGGRRADSSSPSPSLVVLPGQGESSDDSSGRRVTYWQSVAQIGVQVASALEYAHKQGILHRDIKPSNLLLDAHGTVWVTDFGLAKADDHDDLTQTGDMVGTLRYMPSESFEGKSDARSDLYSLGLTLYELLALRPAFDESHRHRLLKQISDRAHIPLDRLNRGIPRDLVTSVHKAIDRDPAHRYQTAASLAADLQNVLDDRPIEARRPSVVERVLRWARHHRGVAASLTAIWLLLTVGLVTALVAAARFGRLANENRDLAEERETERIKAEQAGEESRRRGDAERWERYRANVAAAGTALQLPNTAAARRALAAAPPEYRGWEWRHFSSRLDDARAVLPLPSHLPLPASQIRPTALAFDSLGKRVWAGSPDGALVVWDTATGRQIGRLAGGAGYPLDAVLGADGRFLVLTADGWLRSWELPHPDASLILQTPVGGLLGQFLGPGGRFLVAGRGHVYLWELPAGRKRADLPGSILTNQCTAVFSADVRRVAYSTDDFAVHVWDVEAGNETRVFRGHTAHVRALAFSPDGRILVSGARYPDDSVRLWSVETGKPIAVLHGHLNEVCSVAFSHDGSRLASGSMDQTARLWDVVAGKELETLKGHSDGVRQVVFSPNGRRLVSVSHDATLRLWDAADGALVAVLGGHTGEVIEAAFNPDGTLLASWSPLDATVRLWDIGQVERSGVLRGHTSYVYDVAFSPDGTRVLSAAWDGTARLWDPTSGRETARFEHSQKSPESIVVSAGFSPDGQQIASVTASGAVSVWDLASRQKRKEFRIPAGDYRGYPRLAFQPQGRFFAVGAGDGAVRLMDANRSAPIALLRGHKGSAVAVAFSPDGTQLASCGVDGTVRLWDLDTRSSRAVLREHGAAPVYSVAYSADGKLLASASHDKTVRLWDTATHQMVAVLPHHSAVYSAAFSPDGRRLAVGCADNSIRLWDVATAVRAGGREIPDAEVAELHGHEAYVYTVAWSPDGTRLASASGDYTVRIWDSVPPAVRAQSGNASPSR